MKRGLKYIILVDKTRKNFSVAKKRKKDTFNNFRCVVFFFPNINSKILRSMAARTIKFCIYTHPMSKYR